MSYRDKIENLKTYQIKISEIAIIVNELEGTNYEMYKNKEISLYDYLINNKKYLYLLIKLCYNITVLRKSGIKIHSFIYIYWRKYAYWRRSKKITRV